MVPSSHLSYCFELVISCMPSTSKRWKRFLPVYPLSAANKLFEIHFPQANFYSHASTGHSSIHLHRFVTGCYIKRKKDLQTIMFS